MDHGNVTANITLTANQGESVTNREKATHDGIDLNTVNSYNIFYTIFQTSTSPRNVLYLQRLQTAFTVLHPEDISGRQYASMSLLLRPVEVMHSLEVRLV